MPSSSLKIILDGDNLQLDQVESIADAKAQLELSSQAIERMKKSRALVDGFLEREETAYGVNTGFGRFCRVQISNEQVKELQVNLIRSHGCGVGDPVPDQVARLAIVLRANTLAKGNSGIRVECVQLLIDIFNSKIVPWIPSKGSVGASGDLAPLAHLAQVLIGEGKAKVDGKWCSGKEALEAVGLKPIQLEAKEGLSLINGVQISCAFLALAWVRAQRCLHFSNIVAAVSLESLLGSAKAYDPKVQAVRPHPGQKFVADRMRDLLAGSGIAASHVDCDRVQDAYSFRCVPQVHGAVSDSLIHIGQVLQRECNAATDNPLVFADEAEVISGGNFHGAPIAYVADLLAIVTTDLGSISERRTERLVNPDLSGLPAFLSTNEGLESGFMMAQVTSAALCSENKVLSHPASVDSIPTSAGTEDHVSMSTHAGRKALEVVRNVELILAVEWMCARTALEHRRPVKSGDLLESYVAHMDSQWKVGRGDRDLNSEMEQIADLIAKGRFEKKSI